MMHSQRHHHCHHHHHLLLLHDALTIEYLAMVVTCASKVPLEGSREPVVGPSRAAPLAT
jgi:hypothetical protein